MKVDTELHVVLVELPREVVEDLIVAVHSMTRQAAGRAQLGDAHRASRVYKRSRAQQDDRKPRIESTAIAERSAGCGT